jgi:hypothetical protein
MRRRRLPSSGRRDEHARVKSAQLVRRVTVAAGATSCVAAVAAWGELSVGALLAVGAAGTIMAGLGLVRRAGEAAPPVGRRGLPWLVWATVAVAWELVALVDDDLPTLSDLADPALAHPALRGAATVCWLAAGAWLLARPRHRTSAS